MSASLRARQMGSRTSGSSLPKLIGDLAVELRADAEVPARLAVTLGAVQAGHCAPSGYRAAHRSAAVAATIESDDERDRRER